MTGFFWGFFFIFLDFSLDIFSHEVGLLPDFVGYLVLIRSAKSLERLSPSFPPLMRLSRAMLVFSAGLYVLDLLGVSSNLGMWWHFLSLGCSVGGLFAALHVSHALFDLQAAGGLQLHAQALRSAWNLLALCQMVSYLFLMNVAFSTVCSLLCFGAGIHYLYRLSRCSRAFLGKDAG